MTTKGAYSKKHQYLEKERLRQLQDHAKKADRERVHRLSKETAQRQRALEEKKLAMAAAEEERRKKALEDRRRAQKEATDRFKSAFSRIKSKGASTNVRNRSLNIEYYLPNKQATKFKTSTQKFQSPADGASERIAIGKEVEVNHQRQVGLQKRTPSLDDVLNQLRGEHQAVHTNQGHIVVHKGYYSQQNVDGRIIGPGALIKGRSASDSSLNVTSKQPSTESHSVEQTDVSPMELKREANSIVVTNASDENIVFHPVTKKSFQPPVLRTTPQDELRITSPELPDSSSSSDLSNRSSSPTLEDSLDSNSGQEESVHSAVKQRTKHRQQLPTHSRIPATNSNHASSHANHDKAGPSIQTGIQQTYTHTQPSTQPVYACEESDSSSSSSDSPRHHFLSRPTPPRLRRQARQTHHHNAGTTKSQRVTPSASTSYAVATVVSSASYENDQQRNLSREDISQTDKRAPVKTSPKIVGILKKSRSQSSSKASSAVTTACSSQLTSAAPSMLMESGQNKHARDENDGSICENASTKSLKRVRFKDETESEKEYKPPVHDDFIDSARIELWKRVLPNGFSTHFLPNGAFTPKMKVSLSPKQVITPSAVSGPPRKPNGITVHVPIALEEHSSSPPNTKHKSTIPNSSASNQKEVVDKTNTDDVPASTLKERYDRMHNGDDSQVKDGSPTTTGPSLNNNNNSTEQDHILQGSSSEDHVLTSTTRKLDKTPTDDDINEMWDEIRNTLHENKRVSISPQVFNFRVPIDDPPHQYIQYGNRGSTSSEPSSNYTSESQTHVSVGSTSTKPIATRKQIYNGQTKQSASNVITAHQKQAPTNSGRQLVHRQNRARTIRCQNDLHSPVQMWGNGRHHSHAATYPHSHQEQLAASSSLKVRSQHPNVQRESELMARVNNGSSIMRNAPTALSLEEQRLMQSIEKLDQRMKDHLGRPQNAPVRMSHVSPEPPDFTPEYYPHPPLSSMPPHSHPQTRGSNNVQKKSRVNRKPVQNSRLINNSTRTHYRHAHPTTQRQVLYNK